MTIFTAEMVPAVQSLPAGEITGEDSVDLIQISLNAHLSAEN